ncbi:MAG: radical SAM protein [Theionarchaea archaeon]|nr:radical SAM protein [Theionarchaea archaeon]
MRDRKIRETYENEGFFGEPQNPEFSHEDIRIGMILTTDCVLRCRYCFAEGGRGKPLYLTERLASRMIEEAVTPQTERMSLYFTGGEPTLNPDVVLSSIARAREYDLPLSLFLYTCGIVKEEILDTLIAEDMEFNLSVDGIPSVQNYQRPLCNGGNSSDLVERSIKKIIQQSRHELRAITTVTHESVHHIADSVEYLAGLGVTNLQIETFSPFVSDKFSIDLHSPDVDAFVTNFLEGLDVAHEHGVKLIHSVYENLLQPCTKYCQGTNRMVITPDGYVSPCYTVICGDHPYAHDFFIGKYLEESDRFEYYQEKIEQFFGRTVENTPECRTCFAKYICSGGCVNRAFTYSKSFRGVDEYLCSIRRKILPAFLYRLLEISERTSGDELHGTEAL